MRGAEDTLSESTISSVLEANAVLLEEARAVRQRRFSSAVSVVLYRDSRYSYTFSSTFAITCSNEPHLFVSNVLPPSPNLVSTGTELVGDIISTGVRASL